MKVLVATASRHGATDEIAAEIGGRLNDRGIDAEVVAVGDVTGLDGYDAVVLGSAVYMGRWLKEAREFVGAHGDQLRARPTWLFSSGRSAIHRDPGSRRRVRPTRSWPRPAPGNTASSQARSTRAG